MNAVTTMPASGKMGIRARTDVEMTIMQTNAAHGQNPWCGLAADGQPSIQTRRKIGRAQFVVDVEIDVPALLAWAINKAAQNKSGEAIEIGGIIKATSRRVAEWSDKEAQGENCRDIPRYTSINAAPINANTIRVYSEYPISGQTLPMLLA